jgi:hypothetical protein
MIGKAKLGFFIIVAVIIVAYILLAQSREQTFHNGTFVTAGGEIGNIYQTSQEIFNR